MAPLMNNEDNKQNKYSASKLRYIEITLTQQPHQYFYYSHFLHI